MYKLHRNHQSRPWAGWYDYARLLLHHHMLLAEMQQGWQKKMVREEGRHFDQHLQNWRTKKKNKLWWKENTKKVADKTRYNREIQSQDQLQHLSTFKWLLKVSRMLATMRKTSKSESLPSGLYHLSSSIPECFNCFTVLLFGGRRLKLPRRIKPKEKNSSSRKTWF